jgi:hypothetical protein
MGDRESPVNELQLETLIATRYHRESETAIGRVGGPSGPVAAGSTGRMKSEVGTTVRQPVTGGDTRKIREQSQVRPQIMSGKDSNAHGKVSAKRNSNSSPRSAKRRELFVLNQL